jgi:LPS O-antigen subunit length determinant protein (WzzB/FepE family)
MGELVLLCVLVAALIRAPAEPVSPQTPRTAIAMMYLLTIGVLLWVLLTRLAR